MVIPLFERSDPISLENMQITVTVRGLTSAGVDIEVGALTILKIKNVEEKILAAMEQFNTGKTDGTIANIKETSQEVLEGKLREILSKMSVEEIYKDREKFAMTVQEVAAKELEDMGLEIKAFTIKEIKDDQGYLEAEGLAEAKVIREKAMAEAKEKLAEAYNKYGEAAIMEMALKVLPEITSSVAGTLAEPIGKIGDITIVDTGSGGGVNKVTDLSAELLTKLPTVVKSLTGIDTNKLLSNAVSNIDLFSASDSAVEEVSDT